MFKLTDEQIEYIIEFYGGSKKIIENIELQLNLIGVVEDENDYFELMCAIIAQKETIKLKLSDCDNKFDAIGVSMTNKEIILTELNRKYNNFEDASYEKQQAIKKLI